jgi:hypothetical protein
MRHGQEFVSKNPACGADQIFDELAGPEASYGVYHVRLLPCKMTQSLTDRRRVRMHTCMFVSPRSLPALREALLFLIAG